MHPWGSAPPKRLKNIPSTSMVEYFTIRKSGHGPALVVPNTTVYASRDLHTPRSRTSGGGWESGLASTSTNTQSPNQHYWKQILSESCHTCLIHYLATQQQYQLLAGFSEKKLKI